MKNQIYKILEKYVQYLQKNCEEKDKLIPIHMRPLTFIDTHCAYRLTKTHKNKFIPSIIVGVFK